MTINSAGVEVASTHHGVLDGFFADIQFYNGFLYATNGTVVDPSAFNVVGRYDGYGPIAPDSVQGVAYMLSYGFDSPTELKLFHLTQFTMLKSLPLVNISGGPERLLMVGPQLLALLTTSGDLYLIELGEPVYAPPTFTSTPAFTATEDIYYTYVATATDSNYGDVPAITAPVLPSWLYLSDYGNGFATLNGYPTHSDIGDHAVELLVTDKQGLTATQRFTLTVVANPDYFAPMITTTPELTAVVGTTYLYNFAATDANAEDGLTIHATVQPDWLALTQLKRGTARLSGVPSTADIGEHPVTLYITDTRGLSAVQDFTITVMSVGRVEGLLFEDSNDNGTQNSGEPGIDGAIVTLSPEDESIGVTVAQQTVFTTTTRATGAYRFSNIPTGNYSISFDLPGNAPNPVSIPVTVVNATLTVVPPVAVSPQDLLYLPNVKTHRGTHTTITQLGSSQVQE